MKVTIWTATTDGDNCETFTSAHGTPSEAEQRIRDGLNDYIDASTLTGEALVEAWEQKFDGACIIRAHEVEIGLADDEFRIVASCLSFLDQDENICTNVPCTEEAWNALTAKFGAGVPEHLRGIANVKKPAEEVR